MGLGVQLSGRVLLNLGKGTGFHPFTSKTKKSHPMCSLKKKKIDGTWLKL
jgi:hypothetical protein